MDNIAIEFRLNGEAVRVDAEGFKRIMGVVGSEMAKLDSKEWAAAWNAFVADSIKPIDQEKIVAEFERAVSSCSKYHTEYMGKVMPDDVYERFARLRDETIPQLKARLQAAITLDPASLDRLAVAFRSGSFKQAQENSRNTGSAYWRKQ